MKDTKYEIMNEVQEMSSQKIVVGDQKMKELKYEKINNNIDKDDSFVVDLECVDNEPTSPFTTPNSRFSKLQRSLSKKVPQRGIERKINDKDILPPSLSPRVLNTPVSQAITTPEKSIPSINTVPIGSQDISVNHQLPHHQITIKTGGLNAIPEGGRWGRKSSFKRSTHSWFAHPKRILLVFATLSCMGTMLLIYFTLSMSKRSEKEGVTDWQ
ncbi:hypothetical protein RND81_06G129500 [Saponaria officinalis]|uniref:Uncharacterized protein n=1 Tax=Saponaria officinalis TaxID=3572 RepID=A0AAW1KCU9_SAPOF